MVKRRTFFSFHYKPDNWRAGQVRNIGVIEGNASVSDNDWEAISRRGDAAIEQWIDSQMHGRSCLVVLIGSQTAGRKWIKYEIQKAWNAKKGVLGIFVHNLKNVNGDQASKGKNPFDTFTVGKEALSKIVKVYDPPYKRSTNVYAHISENIAEWIEEAISIRGAY